MKQRITVPILLIILLFSSCFEEDKIINLPPTAGDIELGQAAMTETFRYQVYYDLKTNATVKTNVFTDWDLGFLTSDTAWHIILNNAKAMYGGNSFSVNFEDVTSEEGVEMHFDKSNGNPDSLAIAGWLDLSGETPVSNNFVYVIDRGLDEEFSEIGYKKVIFQTPEDNKYKITFADLDGQNEQSFTIEKDTTVNYVCFSFDNGIVDVEPPKNDWTLLFSLYQTLYLDLTGNYQSYIVKGALLNPHNVTANIDTLLNFDDIALADTENFDFKTDLDIIGFDWKYYNFQEGYYTIVPDQNYMIKNNDGYYYKLRFVDYYNDTNEKGYPKFQFARL